MPRALDETWRLLEDFAEAAQALNFYTDHSEVADTLCELALKVLGGDHASITSIRAGSFTTVAATGDVPEQVDAVQCAVGQGPGVGAVRGPDTVRVDDLGADPRWPRFAAAASRLAVGSMLVHVLPMGEDALGALSVYSSRTAAFTTEHETLIAIFGSAAVSAMSAARYQEKTQNLERALHTSRHIGVALGILMMTHRVGLDQAWELLSKASQDRNTKVSELADRMIETGSLEEPLDGSRVAPGEASRSGTTSEGSGVAAGTEVPISAIDK